MSRSSRKDGLVYSTAAIQQETVSGDDGDKPLKGSAVAVLRIEKKGRKGKSVTIIEMRNFPLADVAGLGKKLRAKCGTGGTTRENFIEIQGDQRTKVKTYLEDILIEVKGH